MEDCGVGRRFCLIEVKSRNSPHPKPPIQNEIMHQYCQQLMDVFTPAGCLCKSPLHGWSSWWAGFVFQALCGHRPCLQEAKSIYRFLQVLPKDKLQCSSLSHWISCRSCRWGNFFKVKALLSQRRLIRGSIIPAISWWARSWKSRCTGGTLLPSYLSPFLSTDNCLTGSFMSSFCLSSNVLLVGSLAGPVLTRSSSEGKCLWQGKLMSVRTITLANERDGWDDDAIPPELKMPSGRIAFLLSCIERFRFMDIDSTLSIFFCHVWKKSPTKLLVSESLTGLDDAQYFWE